MLRHHPLNVGGGLNILTEKTRILVLETFFRSGRIKVVVGTLDCFYCRQTLTHLVNDEMVPRIRSLDTNNKGKISTSVLSEFYNMENGL